jgi:hypothetical protein
VDSFKETIKPCPRCNAYGRVASTNARYYVVCVKGCSRGPRRAERAAAIYVWNEHMSRALTPAPERKTSE